MMRGLAVARRRSSRGAVLDPQAELTIDSSHHTATSSRRANSSRGAPARRSFSHSAIVFVSIVADAGCSGHGSLWISPRYARQAAALGQPVVERAGSGARHGAGGLVPGAELRRRSAGVGPRAGVADGVALCGARHAGVEVRQVVEAPGQSHGHGVRRVEAEEEDARFAVRDDVRADVQLGKRREPRQRRRESRPDAGHAKRDDAEPGLSLERVQRQVGRDERAQAAGVDRPMREQQVVPRLGHHPRAGRRWPRAMGEVRQSGSRLTARSRRAGG